jgi:hypothetical protein
MFWTLSSDFRLRWWCFYFFIWALAKTLSLLKLCMLGCVATNIALSYQTALEGLSCGCLSPSFLSGVGPLEQVGSQKWSCEGLVNEQSQPLPLTGQACERWAFFLGDTLSFQLAPGFSNAVQYLAFPIMAFELFYPDMGYSSSLRQKGGIFPLCIWPSVLFRGGVITSPAVLEQCVALTWPVSRLTWLKTDQFHGSAGRWQTEVLYPLVFDGSWCSQKHAEALWGSLCCIIVDEVADILRLRVICSGGRQLEALCLHIIWWGQMLPDACRSLLFSVFCFSCTDPGRRDLRESKKRNIKKVADQPGLCDPAASLPSWQTDK